MVFYIKDGDIFNIPQIRNYAHGCNCAGAMGKGIAVQFKMRFPKMYEEYRNLCREGRFSAGEVFAYHDGESIIFNLGTQRSWKEKAKLEYIETSLRKMMKIAQEEGVKAIAMPAVGAGLGGCDWNSIMQIINNIAHEVPSVDLYVIEHYSDQEINISYIRKEWPEDSTIFYIHFIGNEAVRQIEIREDKTIYLSIAHPVC